MQKTEQHILSTRPLDKNLLDDAASKNIFIDCISFIETEAIKSDLLQNNINRLSSQNIDVVFTSMNAVEVVKEYLPAAPQWKIFCIGQTTKELVADFFGEQNIVATADSASALADAIIDSGKKQVVFFCGDQRRNELPAKLISHHVMVEECIVYKTIATAKAIDKNYDGILFYSPSAVESFFSANHIENDILLFAIGSTTADAIKKFAGNKIIVAIQPGKEALVKKMIDYLSTEKQVY